MIKKFLLLLVCVAVVAAVIPSYVGAASPSEGTELAAEQQYTEAIDKLQPYLSISETGNIMLDAPKGIIKSIDSEVYESLLAGLAQTNSMIDDGYLVAYPDFTLTATQKYLEASGQYLEPNSQLVAEGDAVILSSSSGVTTVVWHWWGYEFYLSHWDTIFVAGGLGLGGFIAGVVPELFASKIASAILAFGAWLLPTFDTYGCGIIMTFVWPAILVNIQPQLPSPCGVVTGRVTDQATGVALPSSTITASQSGHVIVSVTTDSNGGYSIALSPGTYMITASKSGYYDLGKPAGVSDGAYTTLNFELQQSTGGGGGCPFLYVWDGTEYVGEDYLNIHNAEGVDVTYDHALTAVPERINGAYEFRLIEHPMTISDIDQVQLYAVLEDGTVEELPLISARHSEDGNVLNLLIKSDDRRVEERGADYNGGTSQSIDLKFAALGPNAKAVGFIFTIEGNNMYVK